MQAHPLSTPAAWNTPFLPADHDTTDSLAESSGLAHDAGNLLGALGLYCDLLDMPGVLRPEHVHYARELRSLSQRSSALIDRLLKTQAALRRPPSHEDPLCPAKVLRDLTPLLRSLAAPQACLRVHAPARLPLLPFAPEDLERILVNLTRNAATALRNRPAGIPGVAAIHIRLGLEKSPAEETPRLVLTFTDNAGGMPMQTAACFLKPAPVPPGARSGLGHRIVHELLESTRGNLAIHVVNGHSTTLRIDWAASTSPAAASPLEEELPGC